MEYHLSIKKNEILPLATAWMDLEGIILSENKSDRQKQIPQFHLHVESKEQNKTKKLDTVSWIQRTPDYGMKFWFPRGTSFQRSSLSDNPGCA